MSKAEMPSTIRVGGQVLTRAPHPNPEFTAWAGRELSVIYSIEHDYRGAFWHISVCKPYTTPTTQMLTDAVNAIVGIGVAYDIEPTKKPGFLHAFESEVADA